MAKSGKCCLRYIMVLECVALTLFSFLVCPAEAYSYDERYLDYVSWQDEEVESVTINNPDVDGRIYKITKSKLNIITTPPPTTTKVTTTREKTTKQTTTKKSTTAKSKSSTTAKSKNSKSSSTQKVTKFKAPEDFEESTTENTDSEEETFESEYESAETEEGHMTKKSKILLAIAISLITIGLAFAILYYFLIQKKDKDTDNKSENDLH